MSDARRVTDVCGRVVDHSLVSGRAKIQILMDHHSDGQMTVRKKGEKDNSKILDFPLWKMKLCILSIFEKG